MSGREEDVKSTLSDPDFIRRSRIDPDIYLYYQSIDHYFYCVVVRHENGRGFIVTTDKTDKVKEGELIWTK